MDSCRSLPNRPSPASFRPEWGSNNLAQGRAQRRPGYGLRQREIALKGQKSLGSVVCVGTVCSAPSGQWALLAVAYPGRRFALPWAKMLKPVGLKTQERNTAHNSIHPSFSMFATKPAGRIPRTHLHRVPFRATLQMCTRGEQAFPTCPFRSLRSPSHFPKCVHPAFVPKR